MLKVLNMRFSREYYIELMTFGDVERPMFVEPFGPLIGLAEEWRAQGATDDEINMTAFDWDYVPVTGCGAKTGWMGENEAVIIEENDEHVIKRDYLGRTVKLCKNTATIALPLDFPVKTMEDWRKLKPNYEYSPERIDWDAVESARLARKEGTLVRASIPGGYDTPRELMGDADACVAYYEQPELIHDIMNTLAETAVKVYERVTEKLTIDVLSIHEDLAGKSGPLVGPSQVSEFIQPYYRAVWDLLQSRGARLCQQDSDGNINAVLDAFMQSGVNVSLPMEPAAGMDIVESRRKYGDKLAFIGGIDKHVLRRSRVEIRKELEYKMQPLMHTGAVLGLDHRIPNGTPLENYRYYVETGREILGLPPLDPSRKGWSRMAF